jgi:hypothetical protein
MLDQDHVDRRQLGHLVATEPAIRPTLVAGELVTARATSIRIVIDDLIHLILGLQLTTRTQVPRLTARVALPTHQLLRLRARFRTTLLTRLRRI